MSLYVNKSAYFKFASLVFDDAHTQVAVSFILWKLSNHSLERQKPLLKTRGGWVGLNDHCQRQGDVGQRRSDAGLRGFDTDSTDSQFVNDRVIRIWINSVGLKLTPDKQQQSYNPRSSDQASPFTSIGKHSRRLWLLFCTVWVISDTELLHCLEWRHEDAEARSMRGATHTYSM